MNKDSLLQPKEKTIKQINLLLFFVWAWTLIDFLPQSGHLCLLEMVFSRSEEDGDTTEHQDDGDTVDH